MILTPSNEPLPLEPDADGVIRVGKTRITLDTVVAAFNEGATAEEIIQQYPSLSLADIYSVISYCLRRREDVDTYLRERQQRAAEVQEQNEKRFSPVGIRERLLLRKSH